MDLDRHLPLESVLLDADHHGRIADEGLDQWGPDPRFPGANGLLLTHGSLNCSLWNPGRYLLPSVTPDSG